jgi:hypothetical protein
MQCKGEDNMSGKLGKTRHISICSSDDEKFEEAIFQLATMGYRDYIEARPVRQLNT